MQIVRGFFLQHGLSMLLAKSSRCPTAGLTFFAALAGYSFSLIGKLCGETKSKTFRDIWAKTISPKSQNVVTIMCALKCFFGCLAYTIVLGDTLSALGQVR